MSKSKSVLMIAFHFPPMSESSGYLRPLRFAEHLRADHDWNPQILTVSPYLYPRKNHEHDAWIKENFRVRRAWSLDTQKHLSIAGKHLEIMASPDQWVSWYPFAVATGIQMIRQSAPEVIWSTCPIATSNLVAATLSRLFDIPWIADFRDPMTTDNYPSGKVRWKTTRWVERMTMANAEQVCFTADRTRQHYAQRYPEFETKLSTIPNGYDELDLSTLDSNDSAADDNIVMLHAGALFPDGRNPKILFQALRNLLDAGHSQAQRTIIRLRAAGNTQQYQQYIDHLDLHNHVELLDAVAYQTMRREMLAVDALLLFQGPVYEHAIPAKMYEYLASYKPIIGLITPTGEAYSTLSNLNVPYLANIESVENVQHILEHFYADHANKEAFVVAEQVVRKMSRRSQTAKLNALFESVLA